MSIANYYVILNSCFGRFSFPPEFVAKVFIQFPPDSVLGERLFPPVRDLHILTPTENSDQSWDKYYVIQGVEPISGAYQLVTADMYVRFGDDYHRFAENFPFFATKDMSTYHSLQDFSSREWRTNHEILRLALDENLIGVEFGPSLLRVEQVPSYCGFHIINNGGNEELVVDFPV